MPGQRTLAVVFVALLVGSVVGAGAMFSAVAPSTPTDEPAPDRTTDDAATFGQLQQFESAAAARAYLQTTRTEAYHGGGGVSIGLAASGAASGDSGAVSEQSGAQAPRPARVEADAAPTQRQGTTNVQVSGIDEPDIVKADAGYFYYARVGERRVVREPRRDGARPEVRQTGETSVIDTADPAAPDVVANVSTAGQMLRFGDTLVVMNRTALVAYDVSTPAEPEQSWTRSLNGSVETARAADGTLYLVTETSLRSEGPVCPVEPLDGSPVECTDIYHPREEMPADATYTAFALSPADGSVDDSVSFVGTRQNTVVYMSNNSLYVTYTKGHNSRAVTLDYYRNGSTVLPTHVQDRIDEIATYNISQSAKYSESRRAVRTWLDSLDEQTEEERRAELETELEAYVADRQRTLTRTGVVRVSVDGSSLGLETVATVPGRPLDQFSMDEHNGTLRVATTLPGWRGVESQNAIYTFDAGSLEQLGAVEGMGKGQEVYAARYVGDTAYLVTFRQVDPLHVVNLSDPSEPVERGNLELPGFSTYLHPIDENHILGVGEEDGTVKAVLFDVSDPTNPTIADEKILAARWSAIRETHHAFTIDRRHGVFFLPTGNDAVVMNYTDGQLSQEREVRTDDPAQRARYVGDYLYVFAGDEVTVLNETTWETETRLAL
jgi:inhibitor of cysteine peptidase